MFDEANATEITHFNFEKNSLTKYRVLSGSLCHQSPVTTLTWSRSPHYWSPHLQPAIKPPIKSNWSHRIPSNDHVPLSHRSFGLPCTPWTNPDALPVLTCVSLPLDPPTNLLRALLRSWSPISHKPAKTSLLSIQLRPIGLFVVLATHRPLLLTICISIPVNKPLCYFTYPLSPACVLWWIYSSLHFSTL